MTSCNGQGDGCCTASTPCSVGDGDCDRHDQCQFGLVCSANHRHCRGKDGTKMWDKGDECCAYSKGGAFNYNLQNQTLRGYIGKPCLGGDNCCTFETKCLEGEGDCDSDADCHGDLKCGSNNCGGGPSTPFDNNDDCCYDPYKDQDRSKRGSSIIGDSLNDMASADDKVQQAFQRLVQGQKSKLRDHC